MNKLNLPDRLHVGYVTDMSGIKKPVIKRYALKVNDRYVTSVEFVGMSSTVESFSVAKSDSPPLSNLFGTDSVALAMTASEQIAVLLDSQLQEVTVNIIDTWEESK